MLLTLDIGSIKNKLPAGKIIFNNNVIHSGEYNKNIFVLPQIVGSNELTISLDNKRDKDRIEIFQGGIKDEDKMLHHKHSLVPFCEQQS